MLKKVIPGFIVIVFLSLLGLIIFFPLDSFVKKKIDDALGPDISFKALKIRWSAIVADDVLLKTPAGSDFLKIKQLKLNPSIWGLLRKKLEIKEIALDSPSLVIKRAKNGKWLLPGFRKSAEAEKKKGAKSSVKLIIKTFKVNNGTILLIDDVKGFSLDLSEVVIDIKSKFPFIQSGRVSINASAQLPSSGKVSIRSEGDITTGNLKGVLSIKDLNITLLRPYMKSDVEVKRGRLNLDSNIGLDKGYVKAPSRINVRDLDIETKGIIMGVSAPLVVELIKKKGAIDLDFNIWGKWDNLQNDLKESFQKKVFTEVGRTITSPITSPLEDAMKGIKSLLPGKK